MVERSVVVTSGTITKVSRVTVGRPVRRIVENPGRLENLNDVDVSSRVNGSVLVYSASTGKWTSTLDLEEQNINGGSY